VGRRQQHVYPLEQRPCPADFPERLDEFRRAAGLSWRELARLLRVNVRTVHRWRQGAIPEGGRLLALLDLAADRHLLPVFLPGAMRQPSIDPPGS
jgi:DNA-binding transcriptional regulator YiaG